MKHFNLKDRVELNKENVLPIMESEYEFYNEICNDYNIGDKLYKVCSKVNYQCRLSLACNANCPFCIEKDSCRNNEVSTNDYIQKLDKSIKELHLNGIEPSITITGGEPCLVKDKLLKTLNTISKNNVSKFNLNTNGILLTQDILIKIKETKMPHLNISLHHYDLEKNKAFFGGKSISIDQLKLIKDTLGCTYNDSTRVRIQCVMMKGGIDSVEEVVKFIEFIKELGFDNVAFRGLSKLKEVGNDLDLHNYCEDKAVDTFSIVNELKNHKDFLFNCQNISDHYTYEDWIYGKKDNFYGIDIHVAYSDMDILEKREKEELSKNLNYAREFVLYEDGSFCGGWNKDIKKIY